MTVANNPSRDQYTATSGQTVFPYTFEIFNKDDVVVIQNSTTLSEGTDYTVSGVGNNNGGNITFTSGATAGDTITLYRDMAYERTTDYQTSGDFLAAEVNADFDRLWLAVQQNEEVDSRAVRKPITDADSINMELPVAATRANKLLGFDASGNVSAVATTAGDASSITYTAGYTGSVQRTVQARLDDTVSVKDFGAVGDGTDATSAFIAAVASGAKAVYIPSGTYALSSPIVVTRDIFIYGDGPNTKIDVSGLADDESAFDFNGGGGTLIESNSNAVAASDRRYTFSSAGHGLAADDLFAIWDDNDYSYSSRRANYYKGEYLTVNYVDGAEVSFDESFYDSYGSGTSKLYKVSTISVSLKDFDIISSGSLFIGIDIHFGRQCNIDNVNVNLATAYSGIYLHNCYDVSVSNCSNKIADYVGVTFNMYPFLIGNSQRIRITACNGISRWHAISVGGAADGVNIVNRSIVITGCTLSSQNGAFAGDFHGNVEHSTYTNCTFHGSGCTIGADYNSFVNNKIMDITRDVTGGVGPDTAYIGSQGFYGTESIGYNYLFSGNLMECYGSYLANSFGRFIHILRQSVATQSGTSNLQIVNNNYLNLDTQSPFSDNIVKIYDGSTVAAPDNVDILVDGNSFINKNDPVKAGNSIIIHTDATDANDRFRTITITNNKLNRVDINLDDAGDVYIAGNELFQSFQGININDYLTCSIKNNIIRETQGAGMSIFVGDGDYTVIDGNIVADSWSSLTPPSGTNNSCDFFVSTGANMDYVRVSNNYIKTNGNADYALVYNTSYDVQDFDNKIVGSGVEGQVRHWVNDSSQYVVGNQSLTTREFWHAGTTQTDFAVITFGQASVNGATLVRLHMANNVTGYSGILEFTLEGQSVATATRSGTRYTSTSDPIAGGKVIVSIATDVVTLSLDGGSATETIHCKAEIIKSCQTSVARALEVEWNV